MLYINMELSDEKIKNVVDKYMYNLEKKKELYHSVNKHDPVFMERNRERAKEHFEKNKDKKKQYYKDNQEIKKLNNLYYYYKKNDKMDLFKSKHPDKFNKLVKMGKINQE